MIFTGRRHVYLEFSLFHPLLFNFTSFYFPIVFVHLLSGLVGEIKAFFLSFSSPKNSFKKL